MIPKCLIFVSFIALIDSYMVLREEEFKQMKDAKDFVVDFLNFIFDGPSHHTKEKDQKIEIPMESEESESLDTLIPNEDLPNIIGNPGLARLFSFQCFVCDWGVHSDCTYRSPEGRCGKHPSGRK